MWNSKEQSEIIKSLLKQAEILAGCDTIHYETTNSVYREILVLLTCDMSVKINSNRAKEVIEAARKITDTADRDVTVAGRIARDFIEAKTNNKTFDDWWKINKNNYK